MEDGGGEEVRGAGPEGFNGSAVERVGDGGEDGYEDGGVEGDHCKYKLVRAVNCQVHVVG